MPASAQNSVLFPDNFKTINVSILNVKLANKKQLFRTGNYQAFGEMHCLKGGKHPGYLIMPNQTKMKSNSIERLVFDLVQPSYKIKHFAVSSIFEPIEVMKQN